MCGILLQIFFDQPPIYRQQVPLEIQEYLKQRVQQEEGVLKVRRSKRSVSQLNNNKHSKSARKKKR